MSESAPIWRRPTFLVGTLLTLHALLGWNAIRSNSPVWDEIVYPAAGFDLWKSGRIQTNTDHPLLGKLLLALPLIPFQSKITYHAEQAAVTNPFLNGFLFTYQNSFSSRALVTLPRLMSLFFSLALACLIYRIAHERHGSTGALIALTLYTLSPPIIARASLALLEMPLAFFMTAALVAHALWSENRSMGRFSLWVGLWFLALGIKATALVLLPVFLLSAMLHHRKCPPELARELGAVIGVLGLQILVLEAISRGLGTSFIQTQLFSRNTDFFLNHFPVYFHGQIWASARWYFGLTAWFVKTPLPLTILSVWGLTRWIRRMESDSLLLDIFSALVAGLMIMLGVRSIIATAHYFWLYPVMCLLAAAVPSSSWTTLQKRAVGFMMGSLVVTVIWIQPHHLAYFNVLAGGSSQGYRWLADSDQDWGQDLPTLASWMRTKNLHQILLSYSGAGDPRAYGIHYQDVLCPALISRFYRGEQFKVWPEGLFLAVGTKVLQSEPEAFSWLIAHGHLVKRLGYTIAIYNLTGDQQAIAWLNSFYLRTRRPSLEIGGI